MQTIPAPTPTSKMNGNKAFIHFPFIYDVSLDSSICGICTAPWRLQIFKVSAPQENIQCPTFLVLDLGHFCCFRRLPLLVSPHGMVAALPPKMFPPEK